MLFLKLKDQKLASQGDKCRYCSVIETGAVLVIQAWLFCPQPGLSCNINEACRSRDPPHNTLLNARRTEVITARGSVELSFCEHVRMKLHYISKFVQFAKKCDKLR